MIYEFDANGMTEGIGVPTFINDVFRWYLHFDGNAYVTIPEVTMLAGERVQMQMVNRRPTGRYVSIMGGSSGAWLDISSSGVFQHGSSVKGYLDGAAITAGITIAPVDGAPHVLELEVLSPAALFNTIGANASHANAFVGVLYDIAFSTRRLYSIDRNVYESGVFEDKVEGADGAGVNLQASLFTRGR
jgi:hypothetical protein